MLYTHSELHITELAGPARSLDLEHSLSISILDREPRVDQGAILLDVADDGAIRSMHFHLLETAEAAPGTAAQWTHQMDHLTGWGINSC